jgi:hypothetical protein
MINRARDQNTPAIEWRHHDSIGTLSLDFFNEPLGMIAECRSLSTQRVRDASACGGVDDERDDVQATHSAREANQGRDSEGNLLGTCENEPTSNGARSFGLRRLFD